MHYLFVMLRFLLCITHPLYNLQLYNITISFYIVKQYSNRKSPILKNECSLIT